MASTEELYEARVVQRMEAAEHGGESGSRRYTTTTTTTTAGVRSVFLRDGHRNVPERGFPYRPPNLFGRVEIPCRYGDLLEPVDRGAFGEKAMDARHRSRRQGREFRRHGCRAEGVASARVDLLVMVKAMAMLAMWVVKVRGRGLKGLLLLLLLLQEGATHL